MKRQTGSTTSDYFQQIVNENHGGLRPGVPYDKLMIGTGGRDTALDPENFGTGELLNNIIVPTTFELSLDTFNL